MAKNGDTHLTGQGIVQTVDCNDSTLIVVGTANAINAMGSCWAVSVQGSANTIIANNVVNDITVYGFDQTVLDEPHRPGARVVSVQRRQPSRKRDTMRAHPPGPAGLLCALAGLAVLSLAGCGSNSPTVSAGSSGVQVEIANTINYGSVGTTAEIDCADGKSLTIGGSNNTLTVKGTCANVNIGGADNRITLEKIAGGLSVVGLNNTVTYSDGDPTVNDTGSGNSIRKG